MRKPALTFLVALPLSVLAAAPDRPAEPARSGGGGATNLVNQELRVARTVGLESFGAGARFSGRFVQDGDAPIVIEAELADRISTQQGNGVVFEPQASGGGAIQFVAGASYRMTVVTPGRYVAWERSSFPWPGGWSHAEALDDAQHYAIQDGLAGPAGGWKWIKAGVYHLTAGALRPGARYRASVWIKSASATGVQAYVVGQVLGAGQTGPEWQQFTLEFVQGNYLQPYVALRNESSAPAFFDDLTIEEIAAP